jgi:hypothetical protein
MYRESVVISRAEQVVKHVPASIALCAINALLNYGVYCYMSNKSITEIRMEGKD